ncbi:hypothetical protein BDN72DRAFT_959247 [Pluteus cervinus]|uniref:Uncharacterized protein n=1 Tax=Pluteus cervinus TaxID=181527 RepID=A0ACD3AWX3_9AGAR|nr:hypothetical protein BDN72DRAFT_959247 [Pluteus cervinus]
MRTLSEPHFQTHALHGARPPYNVWTTWAVDHAAQEAYVYGGCRPGDTDNQPVNDFYALKIEGNQLKWRCLTNSLKYRGQDVFASGRPVRPRPFPALRQPAMTLANINGTSFIFIFGGYSSEYERVVADLIAVDISSGEWWFVNVEGGSVMGRMDAAMTAHGPCLYIFGGRSSFRDNCAISSYCMARYLVNRRTWMWLYQDRAYPEHVPRLGFEMTLIPIQHRRLIVILPGRKRTDEDPIKITQNKVFLFDVDDLSFTRLDIPEDDFPGGIRGIDAAPLHPYAIPKTSPFKFIIAGWVPMSDGSLIPELWVCKPYATNQGFQCLEVANQLWEMDFDLQDCVVCNSRIFFMGYKHPRGLDYDCDAPDDSTWNVAIEVVLN